jgi:type IV pilus assembly protein PilW
MFDSLKSAHRIGTASPGRPSRQLGLTLVELMVASAVGLFIVGGLVTVFVQAGRANSEMARLNQQMENGRFALQLLREDLWHAGFWGEYDPPNTAPSGMPPLCTAFANWGATALEVANAKDNFLRVPVLGANDAVPTGCSAIVINRKAGTDVLVVRHASTCIAGIGDCEDFGAGKLYLQASECSDDSTHTPRGYRMLRDGNISDQEPFILRQRDGTGKSCTAVGYTTTYAPRRKVISNIYYVKDDNTLMRSEFDLASGTVDQQSAQALIEGIEHMEIEYGVDADGDGSADSFVTAPANAAAWGNVVAVKVHLLARALATTPGHTDTKTYELGPTSLGPFNDGFNRHVYSAFVRLYNPAGRRDTP